MMINKHFKILIGFTNDVIETEKGTWLYLHWLKLHVLQDYIYFITSSKYLIRRKNDNREKKFNCS